MRLPWLILLLTCWIPSLAATQETPALDARGWHSGEVASGMENLLKKAEPIPLTLPRSITSKLTGRSLLFYFSPSCPHCTAVMPSLVSFSKEDHENLSFMGVATAHTPAEDLRAYKKKFGAEFPMLIDSDRGFASAVGLRSTPAAIVVEPHGEGWAAITGFVPWFQGAEHLLQLQLNPQDAFSSFGTDQFIGETVCAACHRSEANSSALTHHTIAYATLYQREKADDPECVACHVTGLNAGGFEMGDHHSDFASVSCEACHSAGGPHDGNRVDAKESCTTCHDAKHSIAFSLEKGLPSLDHFRAQHMSEEEIQARWTALQNGEAEKPLLAFPDGETVGAAACESCHQAAHSRWTKGPHQKATATLSTHEDGQDPDCKRCHSTPAAFGLGATGFLSDPGVSCESCHGPAKDHVASPRMDNIIGLGESCPECVIEEVCTSCHTPQWDPDWSLDTRLEHLRGLYQETQSE